MTEKRTWTREQMSEDTEFQLIETLLNCNKCNQLADSVDPQYLSDCMSDKVLPVGLSKMEEAKLLTPAKIWVLCYGCQGNWTLEVVYKNNDSVREVESVSRSSQTDTPKVYEEE